MTRAKTLSEVLLQEPACLVANPDPHFLSRLLVGRGGNLDWRRNFPGGAGAS